jgi:hypothetical protein
VNNPAKSSSLKSPQIILLGICALSAVLLLIATDRNSRDFYVLMRFVVFCSGALAAWHFSRVGNAGLALAFVAAALLFNPLFPINLRRPTWEPIDFGTALLFAVGCYQIWR